MRRLTIGVAVLAPVMGFAQSENQKPDIDASDEASALHSAGESSIGGVDALDLFEAGRGGRGGGPGRGPGGGGNPGRGPGGGGNPGRGPGGDGRDRHGGQPSRDRQGGWDRGDRGRWDRWDFHRGAWGVIGRWGGYWSSGWGPDYQINDPQVYVTSVYCGSDGQGVGCPFDSSIQGAFVTEQYSDASCVLNQSWGVNQYGLWVSNGCKAQFEVYYR